MVVSPACPDDSYFVVWQPGRISLRAAYCSGTHATWRVRRHIPKLHFEGTLLRPIMQQNEQSKSIPPPKVQSQSAPATDSSVALAAPAPTALLLHSRESTSHDTSVLVGTHDEAIFQEPSRPTLVRFFSRFLPCSHYEVMAGFPGDDSRANG